MSRVAGVLLTLLLLLHGSSSVAAAGAESPEGMLEFADSLLSTGETYRAATEYLRALHHFGQDGALKKRALTGLVISYQRAGRWNDAAEKLAELNDEFPSPKYRAMLGEALYRAGRNSEAAGLLLGGDKPASGDKFGTLAWLKLGAEGATPPGADAGTVEQYRNLPQKSPALAGVLSALLPGAGHLYVDRPRDAITAFLVNAVFIWGTVESYRREQWSLVGLLGAAEAIWYTGTITGSVNGAEKWNRREKDRFFEEKGPLDASRWSLWTDGRGAGVLYGLAW